MIATVERQILSPPEELIEALLKETREFSYKHQFGDDVCLVGVELEHLIPSPERNGSGER